MVPTPAPEPSPALPPEKGSQSKTEPPSASANKTFHHRHRIGLLFLVPPVLLGAATFVQLFGLGQLDGSFELYQFIALDGAVSKPVEIQLIGAGNLDAQGAEQKLRHKYAQLVDKLRALPQRPKLVLFDLFFLEPDDAHKKEDSEFAMAIAAAKKDSLWVLLGEPGNAGKMSSTLDSVLGNLQRGSLRTGGEHVIWGDKYLRRFILAEQWVDALGIHNNFSIVLKALLATRGWNDADPLTADFSPSRRLLVVRAGDKELQLHCDIKSDRNGVWEALVPIHLANYRYLHETNYRSLESLNSDALTGYSGKIVVVGQRADAGEKGQSQEKTDSEKKDYHLVLPTRQAYGFEVDASVLNDLLEDRYPRRPPVYWEILVVAGLYWLAGLVTARFRWRPLPSWFPQNDRADSHQSTAENPSPEKPDDGKSNADKPEPAGLIGLFFWLLAVAPGLLLLLVLYMTTAFVFYTEASIYMDLLYPFAAMVLGYFLLGQEFRKRRASRLVAAAQL